MRKKLKSVRNNKGLSMLVVAKDLGITKGFYSHIENGKRNPSWKVAQALASYFNMPAEELLATD